MLFKDKNLQAFWIHLLKRKPMLPLAHLIAISCLSLGVILLATKPTNISNNVSSTTYDNTLLEPINLRNVIVKQNGANDNVAIDSIKQLRHSIQIQRGDTLSAIFDKFNFSQATLLHLISADESLLALETLKPGHKIFFRSNHNSQKLQEMELFIHKGHSVIYRRTNDQAFEYETVIKKGHWRTETLTGEITNSFYVAAQRAGLSSAEAATVTQIFKDQLNFSKVIQKGDKFQIVRKVQFVEGEATGQTQIESARVQRKRLEHTAFLFNDGRYYDREGNSLARAFKRIPLARKHRISSRFNPRRVHPVTGRIRPHNGTDFATPTGTKVLSTGDGIVTRVGNHRFAGRYIDIQHGGQYKTRYLHLHRVLVKKGQMIKRGQTIALSGNTGRSTGPHLHFELHINGRPVDPMKADIPLSQSIAKKDKDEFLKTVAIQTRLLNHESILIDELDEMMAEE